MPKSLSTTRVILLAAGLFALSAHGERAQRSQNRAWSGPKAWRFLIQIGGDFQYSQSDADYIAGVNYRQRLGTAAVGDIAFGYMISQRIYLGIRYEYWYAQRKIDGFSGAQTDTLRYHGGGVELGYRGGNARVFWMISGALFYPVALSIHTSLAGAGTYKPVLFPIAFQGRATVGLRLSGTFTALFAAGFRYADLGGLTAPSGPYLGGANSMNLSGPFGGLGLGLTF